MATDDVEASRASLVAAPMLLTQALYGDEISARIFSPMATVQSWLDAEVALAVAQARVGLLTETEADAIREAAIVSNIAFDKLWAETRVVGYPILTLVRMITDAMPRNLQGKVHLGATTQDIMDTGLVLQLRDSLDRIQALTRRIGSSIASLTQQHTLTAMAARTHGQQAVPTTFGAKLATYLSEFSFHLERLDAVKASACRVSLFGAGGTSAAMGAHANGVRREMAELLGLETAEIPWHVSRHRLTEVATAIGSATASATRFAREMATLSSTEVQEISEADGYHRGASSTMPQKANPITAEAVIGMGITCQSLVTVMFRAMEAQHERATGEWQAEMIAFPQLITLGAGCLLRAGDLADELRVDPERMLANLELDDGLIMAEAYMIELAPLLGRELAHDLVYEACQEVRRTHQPLESVLDLRLAATDTAGRLPRRLDVRSYLGQVEHICEVALTEWRAVAAASDDGTDTTFFEEER